MTTTWESPGVLVHHGEIDLQSIEDFFSSPIRIPSRKLEGYVLGERKATGRETVNEWFQWLNDRLVERELQEAPVPAHVAHEDWKSKNQWWK